MSSRVGLREFQESLSRRLAGAAAKDNLRSRLVVESGGRLWLLNLPDAGEVMPVPWLYRVPLTRRWYCGLVNVRGGLYGMADLSDFCGHGVTPRTSDNAFLMCGRRHGANIGLLVQKVVGLRNAQEFTPVADAVPEKPWIARVLQDHEGRQYLEIEVAKLIQDPAFMDIGVGVTA
jgi:twitching motility protein PilI